jgi:hypothetical protein
MHFLADHQLNPFFPLNLFLLRLRLILLLLQLGAVATARVVERIVIVVPEKIEHFFPFKAIKPVSLYSHRFAESNV